MTNYPVTHIISDTDLCTLGLSLKLKQNSTVVCQGNDVLCWDILKVGTQCPLCNNGYVNTAYLIY